MGGHNQVDLDMAAHILLHDQTYCSGLYEYVRTSTSPFLEPDMEHKTHDTYL